MCHSNPPIQVPPQDVGWAPCILFVCVPQRHTGQKIILDKISPGEISRSRQIDLNKGCRALFGSYVEANTDADMTNDMTTRPHGCLSLGPSGNLQGSVKYFDLKIGKVVTRPTIKVLPMPNRVLKLANSWGEKHGRT